MAFLLVILQPEIDFQQTYFSPSQVTVNNGLTLTMVPDTKYFVAGKPNFWIPGVVTTHDKFTLGAVTSRSKPRCPMSPGAVGPLSGSLTRAAGAAVKRSTCRKVDSLLTVSGCRVALQRTTSSCRRTTAPSGSQSDLAYATPKPMSAGFTICTGMQYIPGRSIKTYFNGRLVGS